MTDPADTGYDAPAGRSVACGPSPWGDGDPVEELESFARYCDAVKVDCAGPQYLTWEERAAWARRVAGAVRTAREALEAVVVSSSWQEHMNAYNAALACLGSRFAPETAGPRDPSTEEVEGGVTDER